jgi:hypothetical protein
VKNLFIAIGYVCLFQSCCSTRFKYNEPCNENLTFKNLFFAHLRNIEINIDKAQDTSFLKSLKFVSSYSRVSFESKANYANRYMQSAYIIDKKNWLLWYDTNKCKNIQLKN